MSLLKKIDKEIKELINKIDTSYIDKINNQEQYEQYFTPEVISEYMSKLVTIKGKEEIYILDPGAGLGILSLMYIRKIISKGKIKKIHIDLIEIDEVLVKELQKLYSYLRNLCERINIDLNYDIHNKDFINIFNELESKYDVIIMNPPYGKLDKGGEQDLNLKRVDIDVPNIYAAFVDLGIKLLKENGELVAITPRSFCNGLYFTKFREDIFKNVSLEHIHIFELRDSCFERDKVLQEVVIYKLKKEKQKKEVILSYSVDMEFNDYVERKDKFKNIVDPKDIHKFIKIIINNEDLQVLELVNNMPCLLSELGIEVSTGPTVEHRVENNLFSKEYEEGAIVALFPEHIKNNSISWPLYKNIKKFNYIQIDDKVSRQMRQNGNYVIVKRLTSKEEKRRVVSAVWDESMAEVQFISIDNKLNYFHSNKEGLDKEIAVGLSKYLNSDIVDKWFRIISGSTQVNATDLRKLRYPNREVLIAIAKDEDNDLIERKMLNSKK